MEAAEVGDEPLLHASDGPAWISRDRFAGALAAAQAGAHVIVMNDGFQNPALAKDLCIVAVDPAYGVGNGQVFPAGPLRERVSVGLARAEAIVMLHNTWSADTPEQPEWLNAFRKPVLHASLSPAGEAPRGPLVAFAGLARPEKFFDTLEAVGADVSDVAPFPDHHPYSADDLAWLTRMAAERGAQLITTEKDATRLSPEWRARVAVLPVAARFADEAALDALLAPIQSRMNAAHGEA
jgi:tetraacyldisaccharide 4'-kinase